MTTYIESKLNPDGVLNPEYAAYLLDYCPITGNFTWKNPRKKSNIGKPAGRIDAYGYRTIEVCGKQYKAHRLAWAISNKAWPVGKIDHINGVRDDNRLENLRLASDSQNQMNQRLMCRNKSGVKGVLWSHRHKKWKAYISVNGKQKYLGYFKELSEARSVVMIERNRHHGEFANHG